MPRTTIVTENRTSQDVDRFAAFKFQNKGEHARVAVAPTDLTWSPDGSRLVLAPWFEWVHRIEKPEEKDGIPLQKEISFKGRDGNTTTKMVWATTWVSSPICFGDKTRLRENRGIDPDNCPVCAKTQEFPEYVAHGAFAPAKIRYAIPVMKYATQPGGWIVAEPFSMTMLVWAFTEARFSRLDDLGKKLIDRGMLQDPNVPNGSGQRPVGAGDVDLLLGPCEDQHMQKYVIDVAEGYSVWRQRQDGIQWANALCQTANMPTEDQLQLACGKPVTNRAYLDRDLQETVDGWHKALGGPSASSAQVSDALGAHFGGQQVQQAMANGMAAMAAEFGHAAPGAAQMMPMVPGIPVPGMAVPSVPQPTVQPAPNPQVVPQPEVPAVPEPSVQPNPPGPMGPQGGPGLGGHGLEQFTSPGVPGPPQMPPMPASPQFAPIPVQPGFAPPMPPTMDTAAMQLQQAVQPPAPPSELMQAAAPELAQIQAQQNAALAGAGVSPGMLPPMPAAPAAAPGLPASTAPQMPISTSPPAPQPPMPGTAPAGTLPGPSPAATPADLFTPPAPPQPAEGTPAPTEFSQLANFGQ